MKGFVIFAIFVISVVSQVSPPVWPDQFSIVFVQSYDTTKIHITGKFYYDYIRKYTRIDFLDGKYERVCSSVMPNVTTACNHLIRDGKRYIVYPEKRSCCLCCDQAHGCGILRKDWLSGSKYQGEEVLSGESFNKWLIMDGDDPILYYARKDDKNTPRRLNTADKQIEDYLMNTYSEEQVPEQIFALPTYCNSTCPSSTVCGKFQLFQQ